MKPLAALFMLIAASCAGAVPVMAAPGAPAAPAASDMASPSL